MTFSTLRPIDISAKVMSIISAYDLTSLPMDENTICLVFESVLRFCGVS